MNRFTKIAGGLVAFSPLASYAAMDTSVSGAITAAGADGLLYVGVLAVAGATFLLIKKVLSKLGITF